MKIIERTAHVVVKNEEGNKFIDGITKFQKEGLEIETQYQQTPFSFSALILGYKFINMEGESAHVGRSESIPSRGNGQSISD